MMSISQGNFFLNYLIIIFSCLQATRNRAPSVAWWARRGFEGVYLAGGRPTRGRRAWARDGGGGGSEWLVSYCKHVLNIKGQGWIFGCLPCMFPNMRVQKIWQNRFFVMHTEFLTKRYSEVLSLARNSIYRKLKTRQEHVNDPASNEDGVNRRKLDIPKEPTKQMIEWTILKIEISKQNAE